MKVLFAILSLVILAAAAGAQTYVQVPDPKALIEVVASSEKIVKGAPFSAEAISESVQVLADGNRIVRSSTSRMYRDSEGRFRREGKAGSGGALGSFYNLQSTTIIDPVAGFKYYLNDKSKTFRKSKIRFNFDFKFNTDLYFKLEGAHKIQTEINAAGAAKASASAAQAEVEKLVKAQIAAEAGTVTATRAETDASSSTTKKESLGTQNIEGVEAEGTRTTTTIPAGAIGNERPIDIVYERWYSKDLQLIVLSRHSDPRFGEQTYRLTNIGRGEPDPSVFTVPADYTVQAEMTLLAPKAIAAPATPKAPQPQKKEL